MYSGFGDTDTPTPKGDKVAAIHWFLETLEKNYNAWAEGAGRECFGEAGPQPLRVRVGRAPLARFLLHRASPLLSLSSLSPLALSRSLPSVLPLSLSCSFLAQNVFIDYDKCSIRAIAMFTRSRFLRLASALLENPTDVDKTLLGAVNVAVDAVKAADPEKEAFRFFHVSEPISLLLGQFPSPFPPLSREDAFMKLAPLSIHLCEFHLLKAWRWQLRQRFHDEQWPIVLAFAKALIGADSRSVFDTIAGRLKEFIRTDGVTRSPGAVEDIIRYIMTWTAAYEGHFPGIVPFTPSPPSTRIPSLLPHSFRLSDYAPLPPPFPPTLSPHSLSPNCAFSHSLPLPLHRAVVPLLESGVLRHHHHKRN